MSKPFPTLLWSLTLMNLFRKAQIHVVGIGEAAEGLLDGIAKLGLGTVVKITPPK